MFSNECMPRAAALLILLASLVFPVHAEIALIVHPSNDAVMDKALVKKIYMGRSRNFANGRKAEPVDLESGEVKDYFLDAYLQKDQGMVDAYWARMIFSGTALPPKVLKTQQEVLDFVASHPEGIGYVDGSLVNGSVKAVVLK